MDRPVIINAKNMHTGHSAAGLTTGAVLFLWKNRIKAKG